MLVVRNVFQCKPGQANALIDRFNAVIPIMTEGGEIRRGRLLVDVVAPFWTVVFEFEVENFEAYERMNSGPVREEVREAMEGYTELLQSGHREIFRIA